MAPHVVLARIVSGPGVRSFDPTRLGTRETDAWVGYYRHEWRSVLSASVTLVAEGFGMGRRRTLLGAWYVLRANQKWSPYPRNDPDRGARVHAPVLRAGQSRRRLVDRPGEAARREVDWWRIHRIHQRAGELTEDELTDAVAHLYSYVYLGADEVHEAARLRVEAMRLSDEWVAAGCDLASPVLAVQRQRWSRPTARCARRRALTGCRARRRASASAEAR